MTDKTTMSDVPNLTAKDVGEQMQVSSATVLRWIHEGKLKAFRIGTIYRTKPEWVAELIGQNTTDPDALAAQRALDATMNTWFPPGQ